ncbi:hypothetical protein JCM19039_4708 [Geomicrobium sp. JCM 19039]|nr:hypothetical protein JCM19039_4708 [Geomicrobium sp. JCM 19039]
MNAQRDFGGETKLHRLANMRGPVVPQNNLDHHSPKNLQNEEPSPLIVQQIAKKLSR